MGLFNFFNRNKTTQVESDSQTTSSKEDAELPEIPEQIFVERDPPKDSEPPKDCTENGKGISSIYNYLELDLENQGYNDAIMNPDTNHLETKINELNAQLNLKIRKAKRFYDDFIIEIDNHIYSRSRNGMIDLVEELNAKKKIAESHKTMLNEIEEDAINGNGISQKLIQSYSRGFKNGLAAISYHMFIKKEF